MVFSVASFNINSVRLRAPLLRDWLAEHRPDVVGLQEIKCETKLFPHADLATIGDDLAYDIFVHGQKSYNGVALLIKKNKDAPPPRLIREHLFSPTTCDQQEAEPHPARYIEAEVNHMRLINIYAPNGNPVHDDSGGHSEKFLYKISWLKELKRYIEQELLANDIPTLVFGDFNVCPEDIDCYDATAMAGDALLQPESRAAFRGLLSIGLIDLFRSHHPREELCYSYWDYQAGAFQKNNGLRIDFILASPALADSLTQVTIDNAPRHREKPSDHTPVVAQFAL